MVSLEGAQQQCDSSAGITLTYERVGVPMVYDSRRISSLPTSMSWVQVLPSACVLVLVHVHSTQQYLVVGRDFLR